MNQTTVDPGFAAALREMLVAHTASAPRRTGWTHRRVVVIGAGVLGAVAVGGAAAVAALPPAGEVATPPLAPPVIVNGVGPATVVLPDAPDDAGYVHVELTCYDGTRCHTPGGGVDGPGDRPKVQRQAIPLTDEFDPRTAQDLAPLSPPSGIPVDVDAGTHWRLYAVYTRNLETELAPVGNGEMLGVPGNDVPPDLVPATATNGEAGWVRYHQLTDQAAPTLTSDGTRQEPIPVYGPDATTVIGRADVSRPYR